MVKVDITKEQLRLLAKMAWAPMNLDEGFTQKVTKNTWRMLNKGHD